MTSSRGFHGSGVAANPGGKGAGRIDSGPTFEPEHFGNIIEARRSSSMPPARSAHFEDLRARVRALEQADRRAVGVLPFDVATLDAALPGGGLALGALHEVAGGGDDAVGGAVAARAGSVVHHPSRSVRSRAQSCRAGPRSGHLRRGGRREGADGVFRGRPASRRAGRRRLRDVPPDHDRLAPAAAGRRDVGRHRPCCPAMAPGGGGRRLRPADRRRHALARQRRAIGALAGPRDRPGAMADRTHALPRRRRGGFHSGRLR